MSIGMIVTFFLFLALLFVAMILFWRKAISHEVGGATAHLGEIASSYSKKEEEIKKQFEDLKRQGQQILETAQSDAEQQKQRLLKEINEQKEKSMADTHVKIEEMMQQADRARKKLLEEAEKEVNDRAVQKAAVLLQHVLPENVRRQIHKAWVEDLLASTFSQLERLHVAEELKDAKVVSAFALTDEERAGLLSKIKEKLGREITLVEALDPSIIAGWEVSLGEVMLDGSLRFKIQEAAIAFQK